MNEATPMVPLLEHSGGWAGSLVQDQFNVDTPWHCHEVHQLQYAFDGAMEVEDAHSRAFLPRQLAAWVPAGVLHRTSLHRVRSMSVMFSPALLPHSGDRVRIVLVPDLLREMILEAGRWPLGQALDEKGRLFFQAFAMLLTEWIDHEAPLSLPTSTDPQLAAAMEFTRAALSSATVEEASRVAAMSVRTLRRRFQAAGITWEDYRRRARLLAAIELLDKTPAPIGEVATKVGYESQSAFAKAFSELFRMSPSKFRNRSRHEPS